MIANKEVVSIRLKPKSITKLKEIADKKEIRYTELVRNVVENYLENY